MSNPLPLDTDRHCLFLDFDGTLVEFADRPDAIEVPVHLAPLLLGLHEAMDGAIAIVSGRRIDDIDRHLGVTLPTAGQHGHELRRSDGQITTRPISPSLAEARQRLLSALGDNDPLTVEDKGAALVVHYRLAPQDEDRAREIALTAADGLDDLQTLFGHAIAEIRPRDAGKAGAVETFISEAPFADRMAVFVGDDRTDEDGFRAVQESGGFGIKVGSGDSLARFRLATIPEVHAWIGAALDV